MSWLGRKYNEGWKKREGVWSIRGGSSSGSGGSDNVSGSDDSSTNHWEMENEKEESSSYRAILEDEIFTTNGKEEEEEKKEEVEEGWGSDGLSTIWSALIQPCPTEFELKELIRSGENKTSLSTSATSEDFGSQAWLSAERETFVGAYLSQFVRSTAGDAARCPQIDLLESDVAWQLRGLAALVLQPRETAERQLLSTALSSIPRGVRLQPAPISSGSSNFDGRRISARLPLQLLTRALAFSLNADLVVISRRVMARVAQIAAAEDVSVTSRVEAIRGLWAHLGATGRPTVVMIPEGTGWLSRGAKDASVANQLAELLASPPEGVLLVVIDSTEAQPSTAVSSNGEVDNSALEELLSSGPPMFGNSIPSMSTAPSMSGESVTTKPSGRVFLVEMKNSTATILPMPPGAGLPPPPFPGAPPPTPVQEEELAAMMRDPNGQKQLRQAMSAAMQILSQRLASLPPNSRPDPRNVHMKLQLLQVPTENRFTEEEPAPFSQSPINDDVPSPKVSPLVVLTSNMPTFVIKAPPERPLKQRWERLLDAETEGRILRANRRLLSEELSNTGAHFDVTGWNILDDTLRQVPLDRTLASAVVTAAIRLDAARLAISPNLNSELSTNQSTPSSREVLVSPWALDTALTSSLLTTNSGKTSSSPIFTARYATPKPRSRAEIAAMNLDKHEKLLASTAVVTADELRENGGGSGFDAIGGLDNAKSVLRQAVTLPLKYPRLYSEGLTADAARGVLLFGPPGTGKTALARAVAAEGGASFLAVDAAAVESKWLGESEKAARAVFTLARRLAPCVVYLDEVDALLASREGAEDAAQGALTAVKTTLMSEWDGLRTTDDRVVVIASTNRPFALDEAVLRRLPRRILIDLPDLTTRQAILRVTLRNNRLASDVDLEKLAVALEGYTGSDVREVCREAAVRVAHERAEQLEKEAANNSGGDISSHNELSAWTPLRPICMADFRAALKKLRASVDDSSKESRKLHEWNERYGETTQQSKRNAGSDSLHLFL